jgi:hypothetical protein
MSVEGFNWLKTGRSDGGKKYNARNFLTKGGATCEELGRYLMALRKRQICSFHLVWSAGGTREVSGYLVIKCCRAEIVPCFQLLARKKKPLPFFRILVLHCGWPCLK